MNNTKLSPDWKLIGVYSAILFICLFILFIFFKGITSLTGCDSAPDVEIKYPKRDSLAQLEIQRLASDTARLHSIIDSLLTESKVVEKIITTNKLVLQKDIELIKKTPPDILLQKLRLDWGSPSSEPRLHNLSDAEIKIISIEHAENLSLKKNEKLYLQQLALKDTTILKYKNITNDLRGMLYEKDVQITKFENTPQIIYTSNSVKWYTVAGTLVGSAAVGILVGRYVLK